jgi:hypothetical protein
VDSEPTIDEAAERALLLTLTCEEIAAVMEQPSDFAMRAANERAVHEDRPVDDVLREWFRALVR